jgi:hypothetical protein
MVSTIDIAVIVLAFIVLVLLAMGVKMVIGGRGGGDSGLVDEEEGSTPKVGSVVVPGAEKNQYVNLPGGGEGRDVDNSDVLKASGVHRCVKCAKELDGEGEKCAQCA